MYLFCGVLPLHSREIGDGTDWSREEEGFAGGTLEMVRALRAPCRTRSGPVAIPPNFELRHHAITPLRLPIEAWPLPHGLPPPSAAGARVSAARCPQSADHLQRAASEALLLPAPVGAVGAGSARLRWHRRVRRVCHTGLEPQTSRFQTGLLLTSLSIALDSSGCLVAGQAGMDTLGCCFIGTVTALGGGTVRDVLLGRWRSASP